MPRKVKERKGKRQRKKHPKHPKSQLYVLKGEAIERKNRFCPKCGPGVFMAQHKGRLTCGKCGYTELLGREQAAEGQGEKKKEETAGEEPQEKQEKGAGKVS